VIMGRLFFVVLLVLLFDYTAFAAGTIVLASWYGGKSSVLEGKLMKNKRPFRSCDKKIAAHKSLPIGTKLVVINPDNGRWLNMEVQDRKPEDNRPYVNERELDVSLAAAESLGFREKGVTELVLVVR